jgi:hypothetical protein
MWNMSDRKRSQIVQIQSERITKSDLAIITNLYFSEFELVEPYYQQWELGVGSLDRLF